MLIFPNFKNVTLARKMNNDFNKSTKAYPHINRNIGLQKDAFVHKNSLRVSFAGDDEYNKRVQNLVDSLNQRDESIDFYEANDFFAPLSSQTELNELRLKWLEKMIAKHPDKNCGFLYVIAIRCLSDDKNLAKKQLKWVDSNLKYIEDSRGWIFGRIIENFNKHPEILTMQLGLINEIHPKKRIFRVSAIENLVKIFAKDEVDEAKEKYALLETAKSKNIYSSEFIKTLESITQNPETKDLKLEIIKKLTSLKQADAVEFEHILNYITGDREDVIFQTDILNKILKKYPNISLDKISDLFWGMGNNIEYLKKNPSLIFTTLSDHIKYRIPDSSIGFDLSFNIGLSELNSDWAFQLAKENPRINKKALITTVQNISPNEKIAQMEYDWVENRLKKTPGFSSEDIKLIFSVISSDEKVAKKQLEFLDLYVSKSVRKNKRIYRDSLENISVQLDNTKSLEIVLKQALKYTDITSELLKRKDFSQDYIENILPKITPANKEFAKKLLEDKTDIFDTLLELKNGVFTTNLADELYEKYKSQELYYFNLLDFIENATTYTIEDVIKINSLIPHKKLNDLSSEQRILLYTFVDFYEKHMEDLSIEEKMLYLNKLLSLSQHYFQYAVPSHLHIRMIPKGEEYADRLLDISQSIKYHYKKGINENVLFSYDKMIDDISSNELVSNSQINTEIYKQMVNQIPEFEKVKTHKVKALFEQIENLKNSEEFNEYNKSDKKVMLISLLLKDISVDTAKNNGFFPDADIKIQISQNFDLSKTERLKLQTLIKTDNWFAEMNNLPNADLNKQLQNLSFDLKNDNLLDMSILLTKTRNNFSVENSKTLDKYKEIMTQNIEDLKASQPFLPVTKFPTASRIKSVVSKINSDGSTDIKGVYIDKQGLVALNFNQVTDWEKIGFPAGSTTKGFFAKDKENNPIETGNIKFFVHAIDDEVSLARLNVLDTINSNAVISASYAEKPESKYRFFSGQGLIFDVKPEDVHAGGANDSGSGYNKNTTLLKKVYLPGRAFFSERKLVPDLIKKSLGMDDEEYIDFWETHKNKALSEISASSIGKRLIETISSINSNVKYDDREYNEFLVSNLDIMGVFAYANYDDKVYTSNPITFLNNNDEPERTEYHFGQKPTILIRTKFLQNLAIKNDIPFVVFGLPEKNGI